MSTSSEGSGDHNLEGLDRIDSLADSGDEAAASGLPRTQATLPATATSAAAGIDDNDDNDIDQNDNSTKRPLMTHTKDGKLLSEKKRRRLEKNRLSARECRRRKKQSAENVQREIVVLESENLRLRLQLQIGEEAEDSLHREQAKLTEDMDALLKSGASEAEIYATIEEFKEKFADYGRDRRSAIEFHLRNIERLLMPTKTTTFVMRAIQGGDSSEVVAGNDDKPPAPAAAAAAAAESAASPVSTPSVASDKSTEPAQDSKEPDPSLEPKELFQYLVNYLEVNPAQAAALKDSRLIAQEMDGCLEKALAVLAELRTRLAQTGEDLETEFTNVRSILSPTQAAKFLVWVANNSACIHMLNELWDRVYPAQDGADTAAGGNGEIL
jgi:hypothetical protein